MEEMMKKIKNIKTDKIKECKSDKVKACKNAKVKKLSYRDKALIEETYIELKNTYWVVTNDDNMDRLKKLFPDAVVKNGVHFGKITGREYPEIYAELLRIEKCDILDRLRQINAVLEE